MVKEAYCSDKISMLLKKKGFDELCIFKYNADGNRIKAGLAIDEWSNSELEEDECSAPTHQRAVAWLREKHLYIEVCTDFALNFRGIVFRYNIYDSYLESLHEADNYHTYEEAVEAALSYCLTNLI